MSLQTIALLALDRTSPFEFGVVHEVFGVDRTDDGVPAFELRICGAEPGVEISFGDPALGMRMAVQHGLEAFEGADLVAVPASPMDAEVPEEVLEALRRAQAAGSRILTVCSGAFVLAKAGLLDGRSCSTHWRYADDLRVMVPTARVNADVLFVEDDQLITSAGTAAGIDACLHLVRCELGADVATRIARRMVVPPQRDGGQRQFIESPLPTRSGESLQPVLDHVIDTIAEPHAVADLADRAALSMRTFARRFVAETGTTPARWIALQRIAQARRLLERTDLTVEQVASRAGFPTAAALRHQFVREVGIAPAGYRRRFAEQPPVR